MNLKNYKITIVENKIYLIMNKEVLLPKISFFRKVKEYLLEENWVMRLFKIKKTTIIMMIIIIIINIKNQNEEK